MNPVRLRGAMTAGIGFVVLFVVGVLVSFGNSPDVKSKDSDAVAAAKYVHTLSSSSHRAGLIVGGYLLVLAAIAFVWFTQGLRLRLGSTVAGRLVSGLGIVGATAIAISGLTNATTAGSIAFGDEPVPRDGDTIRILMDLTYPMLFIAFGLTAAALIVTVAVVGRREGLPSWLCYTGWLGALGAIVSFIFVPMVLPLLWFLAVAVTGLTRPAVTAQPTPAPAMA